MRTDETVVANLDDLPCRRERREGVLVRALVAQSTIEPKAGEANLPTNHFGSDIAAASGRVSVVSLSSFRVYRRFLRSLRSDQGRGEVDGSSCGADEVHLRGCRIHARATRVSAIPVRWDLALLEWRRFRFVSSTSVAGIPVPVPLLPRS